MTPPSEESQGRLDCAAVWDRLDPELQRRLGRAALLLALAQHGIAQQAYVLRAPGASDLGDLYDQADLTAYDEIIAAGAVALGLADDQPVPLPDLAAWGIRQCRQCGCTDEIACPDGCHWVAADLCSTCAPGAAPGSGLAEAL
jgi:hypothetical protein